jgi:hypothetical protein
MKERGEKIVALTGGERRSNPDRADRAEETVTMLVERGPRMPDVWTFDVDGGALLHCQRVTDQDVYRCTTQDR